MTFDTRPQPLRQLTRARFAIALTIGLAAAATAAGQPTRFAYGISPTTLHVLPIDPATGAVGVGSSMALPEGGARHLAIDPTARFLWISHRVPNAAQAGRVTIYELRRLGEDVRHVQTLAFSDTVEMVAFEPTGRFAYVASRGSTSGRTSVFRIAQDSGLATQVQIVTTNPPRRLDVDPTGRHLVALTSTNTVAVYNIDTVTGQIVLAGMPLVPMGGATAASSLATLPTGKFVAIGFSDRVHVYQISSQIGPGGFSLPVSGAGKVVVHPTGQFVFATSANDTLHAFEVEQIANGFLVTADALQVPARDLALDPSGRFLYAVDSSGVTTIEIDRASGQLLMAQPSTGPSGLVSIRVASPSERFLYSAIKESPSVAIASRLDATTGAAAVVSRQDLDLSRAAVDPSNRFVIAAAANTLTTLRIDAVTGELEPATALAAARPYRALTFDPAGRFFYATCPSATNCLGTTIHRFTVDGATGAVTLTGGSNPFGAPAASAAGSRIVFDSHGRWAYATQAVSGVDEDTGVTFHEARLAVMELDPVNGSLQLMTGIRLPNRQVLDIAVDAAHQSTPLVQFIYVLSKDTNASGQIVNANLVHLNRYAVNLASDVPVSADSNVDQAFACDACSQGRVMTHPTSRLVFIAVGGKTGGTHELYAARTDGTPGTALSLGTPWSIPAWSGQAVAETTGRFVHLGTTDGWVLTVAISPATTAIALAGSTQLVRDRAVIGLHTTGRIR